MRERPGAHEAAHDSVAFEIASELPAEPPENTSLELNVILGGSLMKAMWLLPLVILALLTIPARGQMITRPSFVVPNGQKKVGNFVWVWRSERIPVGKEREIEADCPMGYVVTGGGYHQDPFFGVSESKPSPGFDGWIVRAGAGSSGPNHVTVYAGCAPASQ